MRQSLAVPTTVRNLAVGSPDSENAPAGRGAKGDMVILAVSQELVDHEATLRVRQPVTLADGAELAVDTEPIRRTSKDSRSMKLNRALYTFKPGPGSPVFQKASGAF